MAHYQKVEYRIGKDGQITETVLNGSGSECTQSTAKLENSLGTVVDQELLPEYYTAPEPEHQVDTSIFVNHSA
jgi:hypothetical protein